MSLKEKAKTILELRFERNHDVKEKWVRLEAAQQEIDEWREAVSQIANTYRPDEVLELKQKLQQILKEFKTTNENASCSLAVEELHDHFCPLKKIIEELLKEEKGVEP